MNLSTKELVSVSIFAGLTAIGAFISIPLGDVPITLQTLFVLLSGQILGPKLGLLSQIVYMILGLVGIPIFAGLTGGLQSILKPSFGFIIGFVAASFVAGKITYTKDFSVKRIWIASLAGTAVIYLIGIPYMYFIINVTMNRGLSLGLIMKMGCLLFLPGDLIKLIISSYVTTRIKPYFKISE